MSIRSRLAIAVIAAAVIALTAGSAMITHHDQGRVESGVAVAAPRAALAAVTPGNAEDLLVPVAPCRIVDTRIAGGKLTTNATRNFAVHGTTGFPAQGGNNGGCGIPNSATAITLSIIAVNAAVPGHLDAWATGAPQPTASVLNFQKGQNTNTGATVAIKPGVNPALSIHAGSGPLDVVIDVTGYYLQGIHARVTSAGVLDWATNRVISSSKIQDGIFQVDVDRNLAGCTAAASAHGGSPLFTSTAITGSLVIVYVWTTSGSSTNAYFYLDVTC